MPFPVPKRLADHVAAVPADEIARQYRILTEGSATRGVLTLLVYAMSALMVPLPVVLICAAADFGAEWVGKRDMKGLVPALQPMRYLGTLAAVVVAQAGYTLVLAFAYQSEAPLAQPFAVGALTLTMLQLASIRVVHLPYAVAGLGATFAVALGAVVWHWFAHAGTVGLALSLISLCAAAYFIYAVVQSNHALHAGIAREREAARVADQSKSRFLAQMSHELRTPLNAILGLGHAEMMQARDAASSERLRLVTEAARGLAVILDDILDMSAIEAGHLPIRPAPCDPAAEVKAAADLFRPLFLAQGLTFDLTIAPDLPKRAVLDAQRLRQCLSNLFSNALKHTRHGGVSLLAQTGETDMIRVVVADSGPGIAPDEAERIFEPFQRGSTNQPGTGLGLSITRALARSMGGDLVLMPSRRGARFELTLAFNADRNAASPNGDAVAAGQDLRTSEDGPPRSPSDAMRVLIVDDIATNRLVARTHLRLLGASTDEAASGEDAVEKVRQGRFDLVLLDMNMPGMDGLSTLRHIRVLPSRAARVPVVAMTADATDAHRRMYLEAGLDGYLAKPLTPEAVAEALSRYAPPA